MATQEETRAESGKDHDTQEWATCEDWASRLSICLAPKGRYGFTLKQYDCQSAGPRQLNSGEEREHLREKWQQPPGVLSRESASDREPLM